MELVEVMDSAGAEASTPGVPDSKAGSRHCSVFNKALALTLFVTRV